LTIIVTICGQLLSGMMELESYKVALILLSLIITKMQEDIIGHYISTNWEKIHACIQLFSSVLDD